MQVRTGHRIARGATLTAGTAAVIFDESRKRILLTRRMDNGRWCLPGGMMEAGETAAESCRREVKEETGLEVRIVRLIGIYTTPDIVLEYVDGNRRQPVAMCFEAAITGGTLTLTDETTEFAWFTPTAALQLDLVEHHRQRIIDAAEHRVEAFIR
jgi:8-oxo-dGTP pyrophosphatase MutT (NUDIX family)